MPVRDAAATLREAISSILRQQGVRLELIVADDGSRDGSLRIVNEFCRADKRLRLMLLPRRGLVPALNAALAQARGEVIARMDADDISHPDRLRRQLALLDQADVVSCRVKCFPAERVRSGLQRYQNWINSLTSHLAITRELFIECPLPHPTLMLRREILEKIGGYREGRFPEDYDLVFRLFLARARFAKCPAVLLDWRESRGRLQRKSRRYSPENFRKLKLHYLKRIHLKGNRPVTVWGAGRNGKPWGMLMQKSGLDVAGFIEISPRKIGKKIYGLPVFAPEDIKSKARGLIAVAVGAPGARKEIRAYMKKIRLRETKDYLFLA